MTDEQRLQMVTDQLILVRDNLFRGMSKSIQKLQARSINEVLELPSHTESPPTQRTWVGLTEEEIEDAWQGLMATYIEEVDSSYWAGCDFEFARSIEAKLKEKNQ